jgi:hypothetical protein
MKQNIWNIKNGCQGFIAANPWHPELHTNQSLVQDIDKKKQIRCRKKLWFIDLWCIADVFLINSYILYCICDNSLLDRCTSLYVYKGQLLIKDTFSGSLEGPLYTDLTVCPVSITNILYIKKCLYFKKHHCFYIVSVIIPCWTDVQALSSI